MPQAPKPPTPLKQNAIDMATQRVNPYAGRPMDVLPDAFPVAQKTNVGVNQSKVKARDSEALGYYAGRPFNLDAYRSGARESEATDPNPMIWLGSANNHDTKMHELGHSIWYNDMHPDTQNAWSALHQAELKRSDGPLFFQVYSNSPSHSFAEAWNYYSTAPTTLQSLSPATYAFLRNLSKFEYTRRPRGR